MAIGPIVTLGYGSFGSVNLLPTLGYGIGEAPAEPLPDPYRPRLQQQTEVRFRVVNDTESRFKKPDTPV